MKINPTQSGVLNIGDGNLTTAAELAGDREEIASAAATVAASATVLARANQSLDAMLASANMSPAQARNVQALTTAVANARANLGAASQGFTSTNNQLNTLRTQMMSGLSTTDQQTLEALLAIDPNNVPAGMQASIASLERSIPGLANKWRDYFAQRQNLTARLVELRVSMVGLNVAISTAEHTGTTAAGLRQTLNDLNNMISAHNDNIASLAAWQAEYREDLGHMATQLDRIAGVQRTVGSAVHSVSNGVHQVATTIGDFGDAVANTARGVFSSASNNSQAAQQNRTQQAVPAVTPSQVAPR